MSCYIAIDLKSFYASVECVERGLDPLTARLVVADVSRTEKTICLAVSPALKALGLPGRPRLFEVLQKTNNFIIAQPQMRKYMAVSAKVFGIYAKYIATEDIHVYSVDEAFLDVTHYLENYHLTARELAMTIIKDVLAQTGITATAGIGTNMYLAKVTMDIEAKHIPADENGVRIAELDEKTYRHNLWTHRPLTDFWRVGPGYAKKLAKLGICTMGDLARYSINASAKLYEAFGINAELLIDHAWGWEPTTIRDIKNYKSDNHSISIGQVLSEPYDYDKARLITWEMADALSLELAAKNLVTDQIVLTVQYDASNKSTGESEIDYYGRKVPKAAHGTINLGEFTNSGKNITSKALELFDDKVKHGLLARRFYIVANHVKIDNVENYSLRQLDIFTDYDKKRRETEKEKRLQAAEIKIKQRYGKNSILKLKNFEEGATMQKRNGQVGGHKA